MNFIFRKSLILVVFIAGVGLAACGPQLESNQPPAAFADVTVFAPGAPGAEQEAAQAESGVPAVTPVKPAESGPMLVVYEKSGLLWVWKDGQKRQLTSGGQENLPVLSQDGSLVAFQHGDELWMVDISGQNLRKVYSENGVKAWQVDFAPGSHKLYFSTAKVDGTPLLDLWMADAGANTTTRLLSEGQGGHFTFSPHGELLALAQADRLMTVRPDGSGLKTVYQFQAEANHLPEVSWLDNAFGFKAVIPQGGITRLMFILADGGPVAQLAEFPAISPQVGEAYIAPDGSRVAYLRDAGGNLELHIIDASTADRAYLSGPLGRIGLLGWSPDSQAVLYWQDDPGSLWLAQGDTTISIDEKADPNHFAWAGGERLLFLSVGSLRVWQPDQAAQSLDDGVGAFDVVVIR